MRKGEIASYSVTELFLKLSLWVIPTFVAAAIFGLYFLAQHVVSETEQRLSMRVGNLSGRVASGLERLSDTLADSPELAKLASQEVLLTLMSDPAVECAVLSDAATGDMILQAPVGLGCHSGVIGTTTDLALWYDGEADLAVTWSDAEVAAARSQQRELSLIILLFGLCVALITNWLAFRVIIGRPLQSLISRIDDARVRAEHDAMHDTLTGLANRRALDIALHDLDGSMGPRSQPMTILSLDLDGFKLINDSLGHPAGDFVLREVAHRLSELVDKTDVVARVGGDEFVVVLGPDRGMGEARSLAIDILRRLDAPISYHGEECRVGTSIGIASATAIELRGKEGERAMMNADIALYEAKRGGRRRFIVYDSAMRAEVEERRTLAEDIEQSIAKDELELHYQPQYDTAGTRIVGMEALIRWRHPRLGLLMPGRFLSLANELDMTPQLDRWVLTRALRDMEEWKKRGLVDFTVSVNVSDSRLKQKDLCAELNALSLPPGRIVFEVLESICLDTDDPMLEWNVDGIKALGIALEIDDFGTERASIASVLSLHPDRLKVARELVSTLGDDASDRSLIEAVVALGRAMNVGLIAEGVETEEQLACLRDLNFERMQGFGLCRPAPFFEITKTLVENRRLTAA